MLRKIYPLELLAMKTAARGIAKWRLEYGDEIALDLVLTVTPKLDPAFQDAFSTAFGL